MDTYRAIIGSVSLFVGGVEIVVSFIPRIVRPQPVCRTRNASTSEGGPVLPASEEAPARREET